jgi:creatinine amidohydrolase
MDAHSPAQAGAQSTAFAGQFQLPVDLLHCPKLEATMNLFAEMSWEEVKEYLARDDRVILPLGSTEEHGRHLGLGTDSIEAEAIARGVGEASSVIVAPTLPYGMALPQMAFPGTIALRPVTLIAVLEDVLRALYRHGFRRVLVVNGHGGNNAALSSAVQSVTQDLAGLRVKSFEWWTDAESYRVVIETMGEQVGSHASPGETAFMLAVCPRAVKLDRLTGRDAPVQLSCEMTTVQNFARKYPDGIMGCDPRVATREAGEALLRKSVEICTREVKEWGDARGE